MIVAIHLRIDKLTDVQLETLRAVLAPSFAGEDWTDLIVERTGDGQVAVWRAPPAPAILGGEIPHKWPRSVAWAGYRFGASNRKGQGSMK